MKTYINLLIAAFMLISLACGHNIQKEKQYTPPSVKVQPRFYYPLDAQEKLLSGTTKVILTVSKIGVVDRVDLKESSGYDILDKSAIEYCKNLLFNPAKVNGENIFSRIEWELKFNFSDQKWDAKYYVEEINELLVKLKTADQKQRKDIEDEILFLHNEYIMNMTDLVKFNSISEKVILPEISKEWQAFWDGWPLSFLLYHDFIKRFNDYGDLDRVKLLLKASVKSDIQYIRSSPFTDMRGQGEKDNLLIKIRQFFKNNYPDIIIEDLGFARN